jgi:hypothetical protein
VTEVLPLADHTEAELLSRVAGLEAHSDHPLARAIVEYARGRSIPLTVVSDVQVIPGKGAHGRIDGRDYWLGSHRTTRPITLRGVGCPVAMVAVARNADRCPLSSCGVMLATPRLGARQATATINAATILEIQVGVFIVDLNYADSSIIALSAPRRNKVAPLLIGAVSVELASELAA